MSRNEFDCLTNALIRAGVACQLPAAFEIPHRVRDMIEGVDVRDVRAVAIHQCPQEMIGHINYKLWVFTQKGLPRTSEFQATGLSDDHDLYVLYDRLRDGAMKHLHLLH